VYSFCFASTESKRGTQLMSDTRVPKPQHVYLSEFPQYLQIRHERECGEYLSKAEGTVGKTITNELASESYTGRSEMSLRPPGSSPAHHRDASARPLRLAAESKGQLTRVATSILGRATNSRLFHMLQAKQKSSKMGEAHGGTVLNFQVQYSTEYGSATFFAFFFKTGNY